jgi:hypothetical protein
MNIYYRFIRNNQDYEKTLSTFYERGYHWSSLIPNIDNVKNSYIIGINSYLRYGCHGYKLNDFKKTTLECFNIHSANFINLKIKTNSVLELG